MSSKTHGSEQFFLKLIVQLHKRPDFNVYELFKQNYDGKNNNLA